MRISKAVIPIAGRGTRMAPLTRAVPKALLPLPGGDGRVRPIVHWICAEAAAGGAERVALVISPGRQKALEDYFAAARDAGDRDLPAEIRCIVQPSPRGFGDAVTCAREFVADEPFLLLLGDHVHQADAGRLACAAQVAGAFAKAGGAAMIGMQVVGPDELPFVGVSAGEPVGERIYRCTAIVEKPDLATARAKLRTPGLADDTFLANSGIFAFGREIFQCLAELADRAGDAEIELTAAQEILLRDRPSGYHLHEIAGTAMDTGTPEAYRRAFVRGECG